MTGTVEAFEEAPDRSSVTVTLPGFGNFIQVCDGEHAWSADPQNGFRELAGGELAAARRNADFYLPVHFAQSYPGAVVKGKEDMDGHAVYLVEVTGASGDPETLTFDAESALLVHRAGTQDSPQGKVAYEVSLEDYQQVDGVKIPSTIRQSTPANFVLHMSDIRQNVTIDASKFEKPSAAATAPAPAEPPTAPPAAPTAPPASKP